MWAGFTALGDGVQLDLPMPQSERICTNSPSRWRSSSWPASKTNQGSLARHSRDQLRNVERMVMRPCPAAQKPSAVKRRAKRPSECAIVWH